MKRARTLQAHRPARTFRPAGAELFSSSVEGRCHEENLRCSFPCRSSLRSGVRARRFGRDGFVGCGSRGHGFVQTDRRVGDTLPVHNLSYAIIRETADHTGDSAAYWPANPGAQSFLGKLRARVGDAVAFDLPTEAEWEFAARAGTSGDQWPNGAAFVPQLGVADPNIPASFNRSAEQGVEPCGSHEPSIWGIYDMNGSMWEWCLDWYESDVTTLGGRLNIDPTDGTKTLSGAAGSTRCFRGGAWTTTAYGWIRHTLHWYSSPTTAEWAGAGVRVACPVTLK